MSNKDNGSGFDELLIKSEPNEIEDDKPECSINPMIKKENPTEGVGCLIESENEIVIKNEVLSEERSETIHEGHKDFKCESCGKSFSRAGSLKIHIHSVQRATKIINANLVENHFLENSI